MNCSIYCSLHVTCQLFDSLSSQSAFEIHEFGEKPGSKGVRRLSVFRLIRLVDVRLFVLNIFFRQKNVFVFISYWNIHVFSWIVFFPIMDSKNLFFLAAWDTKINCHQQRNQDKQNKFLWLRIPMKLRCDFTRNCLRFLGLANTKRMWSHYNSIEAFITN